MAACSLFLHRGGSIHCFVTVLRCHSSDLLQGVSCTLSFRRDDMRKLFTLIHEKQQPEVIKKSYNFKSNPLSDNFPHYGYDCIELMMADRDIITLGGLLSDKLCSSSSLKATQRTYQNPPVDFSPSQTHKSPTFSVDSALSRNHHIITTIGYSVSSARVFDCLYTSTDPSTLKILMDQMSR